MYINWKARGVGVEWGWGWGGGGVGVGVGGKTYNKGNDMIQCDIIYFS